jgi:hypothetical protein
MVNRSLSQFWLKLFMLVLKINKYFKRSYDIEEISGGVQTFWTPPPRYGLAYMYRLPPTQYVWCTHGVLTDDVRTLIGSRADDGQPFNFPDPGSLRPTRRTNRFRPGCGWRYFRFAIHEKRFDSNSRIWFYPRPQSAVMCCASTHDELASMSVNALTN